MPFPFNLVCDLLETCHQLTQAKKNNRAAIIGWFTRHRGRIGAHDTNVSALLSTLLPEKRTDRVYCVQTASLEKIVGRALMLGSSRIAELALYKKPGQNADLGDCVERILTVTPNPSSADDRPVSVEDIDSLLHNVASRIKWSSPSVRASQAVISNSNRPSLEEMIRRLNPREAKWLVRLVLKDYRPVVLEPQLVYRLCDPLLPHVLKIQDDFSVAISVLGAVKSTMLPNSLRKTSGKEQILSKIKPKLGVKVGRQCWLKGRSIKHCLDMGHGRMSVEQKLDGEYCQIHVRPGKAEWEIQIFSKSGKDSTEDRHGIVSIVRESLGLDQPDCQVRRGCILEGELLVFDHKEGKILPFHKIRNHVTRRGRFLNTEQDSPPKSYEKLMIVYYDLLLLDNESLLTTRHSERFKLLERLIRCTKGKSELVQRKIIDFGRRNAASDLRNVFARTIQLRSEGLVLKPDDPYFDFTDEKKPFSSCCIKLKKEYIGNFGDVGDFAVVGAGFDAAKAKAYGIPDLEWTHFFIACLNNKEEVKRWDAVPDFTIVNVVEISKSLLDTLLHFGQPIPVPVAENTATRLHIAPGVSSGPPLSVAFMRPLVFDLRCFSFDKAGNTGFWSLRFPTVTKLHFDRDYTDTMSFAELQQLAADSITAPEQEDSQENLRWIAELERADPRGIAVDMASQLTATTMPTPSPRYSPKKHTEIPNSSVNACSSSANNVLGRPDGLPNAATRKPALFAPEQLITPPTSSPPAEPLNVDDGDECCVKRPASFRHAIISSSKRRRLSLHSKPLPVVPSESSNRKTVQREALQDIDGNSSQKSTSLGISFQSNDENYAPDISQGSAGLRAASPLVILPDESVRSSTSSKHGSQRTKQSASLGQVDSIGTPESVVPPSPQTEPLGGFSELEMDIYDFSAGEACECDGTTCPLTNAVVFVSPTNGEARLEISALLRGHGMQMTTEGEPSAQQRLGADTPSRNDGTRHIIFVDSISDKLEAAEMLSALEAVRNNTHGYERDWVDIYDWRVLRDLPASKGQIDAQLGKGELLSNHAGFSCPWQRWHCGFV